MSITLDPIIAKIGWMRDDVRDTGKLRFCVDEAVKEVCRNSLLLHASTSVSVLAAAFNIDLTTHLTTNNRAMAKVNFISWANTVGNPEYLSPIGYDSAIITGLDLPVTKGVLKRYSQFGDVIRLYPSADIAYTLTIQYSYIPTDAPATVDLPDAALTAIEASAMRLAMMIPGQGQNLGIAATKDLEYKNALNNLMALHQGGQVMQGYQAPPLYPGL